MNFLNKIYLILILASCFCFTEAQDCKAILSIQSNADSTKLFLNDAYFASGKNITVEIDTGSYTIKLQRDLWGWNSEIIKDTIRINECKEYERTYTFENKIIFDTDPQNVYVFKGDSLIGFTPLLIRPINETLTLKKPDYTTFTTNINEVSYRQKPVLQFIGQQNKEEFYETTWFKVLVSTVVALGATTAYYKLEADKKFDEYQITGDPALLDQTDKYDVISGVTFVAMQINFGLILYLFLTN